MSILEVRPRQQTKKTSKQWKKIALESSRIIIREVAEDVGISIGSCHLIFSNVLGMKRVAAKFVPKLLNFEQKQCRISIAQELLNDVNNDPGLLKRVIMAPCDFVVFPKLKKPMKGKRYATIDEIKSESKKELMVIRISKVLRRL